MPARGRMPARGSGAGRGEGAGSGDRRRSAGLRDDEWGAMSAGGESIILPIGPAVKPWSRGYRTAA